MHDMLGMNSDYLPKFAKDFLAQGGSLADAFRLYTEQVRSGESLRAPQMKVLKTYRRFVSGVVRSRRLHSFRLWAIYMTGTYSW